MSRQDLNQTQTGPRKAPVAGAVDLEAAGVFAPTPDAYDSRPRAGQTLENVRSERALDDPARMGGTTKAAAAAGRATKKFLTEDYTKIHRRLMNWYLNERELQAYNRYQMAIDEDFFDGLQWTEEEAAELASRGQAPIVYNHIKPTINWLLGTERRTRTDGKVLPREESDEKTAETKSKMLKYCSDVNRLPWVRSEAWADCVIAGVGWLEDSISTDPEEELLNSSRESWRNIWVDSLSLNKDINKDARYLFRRKDLDLDYAIALCPEYAAELKSWAIDADQLNADDSADYYLGTRTNTDASGDYAAAGRRGLNPFNATGGTELRRERVRLIECWYRMPERVEVLRGSGYLDGEDYDAKNPEHQAAIADGICQPFTHVRMQMRVALMTESFLLYEGRSPYKHNRFPFTPMWCYKRRRDNAPYGVIRDIRDAQEDYNKRASKALFLLSSHQIIMEEGAVEDIEELRDEASRPNGILVVKGKKRLEIAQDKQLAEEQLQLMDRNKAAILDVGGVTNQNLGQDDKGLSGRAIGKLQDQGSIVNTPLFDNRLLALQIQNEIQLSLLEQFYTAARVIRVVGEKKPLEWMQINQLNPEGTEYVNDITKTKADYIIDEQDFKASTREAMFEAMMELCAKLPPEVSIKLLDMVIDFADVPNKEEIVARIRKLNGERDPSRKPTPEEQAQMDKQAAEAEEAKQLQKRGMLAEIVYKESQGNQLVAMIQKIVADALVANTSAAYQAIQAAQVIAVNPGATPVADAVLAGAGWKDMQGQDPNIPQPAAAAMPVQPQQPTAPAPELLQADGAMQGIETPAADGVIPQPEGVI